MLARAAAAGVEAIIVVGADAPSSRRAVAAVGELSGTAFPSVLESSEGAGGTQAAATGGADGGAMGDAADATRGADDGAKGEGDDTTPVAAVELYATAGVAPHYVLETTDDDLGRVEALLDDDGVVAVGEIGLDYHYDMPPKAQRTLFARQLAWAVERDLPVVVHSREAEDDVLAGLRDAGCRRGVIHCFTEGPAMAEGAVELGLYVSFAGILTFKNAPDLRDIAAGVPLERTLIETDSPYLAPEPRRGRRNEPAYVIEVARTLAELHGVDVDDVVRTTARNARELFRLPG